MLFKIGKVNLAGRMAGEGEFDALIEGIEFEVSAKELADGNAAIITLVKDVVKAAREEAREQRADDRDARRSHERVERVRARRWARRDDE